MEKVRTLLVDGHYEHQYDNGLVERPYKGLKNSEWWHTSNPRVRVQYLWSPQEGWRWHVYRTGVFVQYIAAYPEDQRDSALMRMRLEPPC